MSRVSQRLRVRRRRRAGPLAAAVCGVALLACAPPRIANAAGREDLSPEARATLDRYLPGDAVHRLSPLDESAAPGLRFETDGPGGPHSGEMLLDGTLVRLARPIGLSELPRALVAPLLEGREIRRIRFEHVRLMAYEIERGLEGGYEHELFVDPRGRRLFELTKPPEKDGDEFAEALSDLTPGARRTLEAAFDGAEPIRLQHEVEWGQSAHAAKWRGPGGVQEIKILEDGRVLFVELPRSEPVPTEVRELADGASIEAMLLDAWAVVDRAGEAADVLFLSTGAPIESHR